MSRDTLTGSRIRERRIIAGLKQADLARQVGISASYLNLIEHNRRRIAGKLVTDIAQILGVDASMLTEGAEAALIATLHEAAAGDATHSAESDRAEEFAGRFPGWANALAQSHRRIATLEQTVETLSDRLSHDPHLAASLHDVLQTASAIGSTAAILAEPGEIEPDWTDRFHRNIHEDSQRLAASSRALVRYLDDSGADRSRTVIPQEEVDAWIAQVGWHFPPIEEGGAPDAVLRDTGGPASKAAREIARAVLDRYAADAAAMPLVPLQAEIEEAGLDPLALAEAFKVSVATVLRRLAAMPPGTPGSEAGLVICDSAGAVVFRKAVEGFSIPRFGAACPLWPVFTALSRPLAPLRRRIGQLGRGETLFDSFAIAEPVGPAHFDRDPVYESTMLLLPVDSAEHGLGEMAEVGNTCRVCPRADCRARREPSILSEEF